MRLSNLQLIMMAEVNQQQSTGYDLTKLLLEKGWKASHQQIYRDMAKLERLGLVSLELVPQSGKPDKKLYLLTPAGQEQLTNALDTEPSVSRIQDEALVHLFLANTYYFEQLECQLRERLKTLREQVGKDNPLSALALTRELLHLEIECDWAVLVLRGLAPQEGEKAA
ncbi:PadR family transcriptional regulator [Vibrio sp. La 4.2.2]|uniref:PadR family transcriptional regulator n=1 Tax=Vibrio sp. La 4.2.2 TaxID=2998830 RepID=UPI0022CE0982|nr:PadR family transcriptional regulator [Vibrio sp. La 4.2.2]MDA0109043.1 PadR family transcriptional regulator [Vibrio sp. La 4.2.2]